MLAIVGLLAGLSVVSWSPTTVDAQSPTSACPLTYTVVAGDYWFGIAKTVGTTASALLAANAATVDTPIYPGDTLCLPAGAVAPATTTTTTVAGAAVSGSVVPIQSFPVQGPCVFTDTYGAPRSGGRAHEGVDLIAKTGQYIYAVVDGTLTKQDVDRPGGLSGNAWWLTGNAGAYFFYAHLSAFATGLKVGSKVVAGQIIGFVGETGNAGIPHLHFEVHPTGGASIDPTPTVKAVDGCKVTAVPAQPGGVVPAPATPIPATTAPATGATTATTAAPPASAPTAASGGTSGALWSFIAPVTAYDTSWTGSRIPGGTPQKISIAKLTGVPSTTAGVMVRLSTKGAAGAGWLTVHACDTPPPFTASLTFPSKTGVVGTSVVTTTASSFCLSTSVALAIKVEIIAFRSTTGVGLQAIPAARALDTRTTKRLSPGATVKIDPTALGVVAGTQALSTTITVVDPSGTGTLFLGFCGSGPWSAPINGDPIMSFSTTMRVTGTGWCLSSSVATDVVVDVTGIWSGTSAAPTPVDPVRVYDSRTTGATVGATQVQVAVAGQGKVPWTATTAIVSISTVSGAKPGIVFLVPCGQERSVGAAAASSPKRITTSVVPVALANGWVCISALEPVDVIVDVLAAA